MFGISEEATFKEAERIIRSNFERVSERISRHAQLEDVRIVAITKYVDELWCRALISVGLTELGENRILEGIRKYQALRDDNLCFTAHMVGTIQSNKAKKIPGNFDIVQSVDREKVAGILSKKCQQLGIQLPVLIEVNIDKEPQKSGVLPENALELTESILKLPGLKLRGLMCIPKAPDADGLTREYEMRTRAAFAKARKLYEELRKKFGTDIDILSMGMSLDFEWAIEEGANMIRLGRILYLKEQEKLPELG